jgi:thymidylate synthase (FAD)
MNVDLVSITQFDQHCGGMKGHPPEAIIAYTARVSNPTNQANTETGAKLLKYLITHKHWSPFEMVDMTVSIETSRAIAAQILRHRSFSFQEFSQRYAQAFDFEVYDARRQDEKNRQNSIDDLPAKTRAWFRQAQIKSQETMGFLYHEALKMGIAKEQARMLLPLGTTTKLYMKGSVRSWIHYLQTRTDPSTQKEHRDVALAILSIFREKFPNTAEAVFGR